jgi:hypothetical protein
MRSFIGAADQTRFDRGRLAAFGEYGLEFEFVYYVLNPDFSAYRDIQQRVNFLIMDLLAGMDVKFAVPARMLHAAEAGATDITAQATRIAVPPGRLPFQGTGINCASVTLSPAWPNTEWVNPPSAARSPG